MKRLSMLGIVVLAAFTVGASGTPTTGVPAVALGPMKKYAAAVAAADAERARAVDQARVVLVGELKAAQKSALDRNDIDGAMAVAELVKSNTASVVASERETFAGSVWQSSAGWRLSLLADGTIKFSDGKDSGTWSVIGERTVAIFFNHGFVDVWKFDKTGKGFKGYSFKRDTEYEGAAVGR